MKRNKFSLSNYKLLSMDMGLLVPINWYEVLPGDTFQQNTSALIRVAPMVAPVMHPVRVRIHHWFVPNRLIWDSFEDFITGGDDGNDATVPPKIQCGTVGETSLGDYLGITPHAYGGALEVSALPFRAYNKIYNNFYRDQDLTTEVAEDDGDGVDTTSNLLIQRPCWEKDYFTTSRPWTQKGSGVTIPLGTTASVEPTGTGPSFKFGGGTAGQLAKNGSDANIKWAAGADAQSGAMTWNDPQLYADLSSATGIDIADLRLALAIQRYQEARGKYGSRYVEYLRSLGVRSSDGRLSLPEYLGGGRQTIQFSEVIATAEGTSTEVGDLKGHGIAAMKTNRYRRFFEEHGIVMTLMSVVPKTIYTNQLHRGWFRTVKEDYYQRELAMIGDQEIYNKEIKSNHATPEGVFGYQARYDEYRSLPSSIAGEFRSTLNYWHMGRIPATDPALNSTFVQCVPTDRIYASTSTDPLYVFANHSIQGRRAMQRIQKTRTF